MKKNYLLVLMLLWIVPKAFSQTTIELVKDINPTGDSEPKNFTAFNDYLFFAANDGINVSALWRTDGTTNGTFMISNNGNQHYYVEYNGNLYFSAGNSLWKSDGTEEGTYPIKDFLYLFNITKFNGNLYFNGKMDSEYGRELWISDGTTEGTQMLKDINPGSGDSQTYFFSEFNGKLYFRANNGTNGRELWVTDGTTAGTQMLKDINLGSNNSDPVSLVEFNGKVYFNATSNEANAELWVTDGTPEGTQMVKDINPGNSSSSPQDFTEYNGKLYFSANGGHGYELWVTDGTAEGTQKVTNIYSGAGIPGTENLTVYNGRLYFSSISTSTGKELWAIDDTPDGLQMIKDISPGTASSSPDVLTEYKGKLYFKANDGINGYQIWVTDGTEEGTQMIMPDVAPLTNPLSGTHKLFVYNQSLYFAAKYTSNGIELYKLTDNSLETVEQTVAPTKIYPNPVNDFLHISAENQIESVSVYNLSGQKLISNAKLENKQINVSRLIPGTYILQILYKNGKSENHKIIKK